MIRSLLFGWLLACAAPAMAGQAAPAPPAPAQDEPDREAVEAARALLTEGDFENQMEAVARQSSEASFTTLLREIETQNGTDLPADLEARFREIMSRHVEALIAEMRTSGLDQAARVYARYFTAAEIRELQRLQSHPVLQKMQRLGPQFLGELNQIGLAMSARRVPTMIAEVLAAVEDWHRSHPPATGRPD